MSIFKTIKIGTYTFLRPNDLTFQRESILAQEYQTLSGDIKGDLVGWKYSDMTLEWDTLPQASVNALRTLQADGAVTFKFDDSGGVQSENVLITVNTQTATRFIGYDGAPVWANLSVEVRFLDAHNS